MMKRWIAAAALFAMSAGALADTYEFDSITNLTHNGTGITGVLVNDTVPTTLTVSSTDSRCVNWLQLMMTSPGQFTLSLTSITLSGPPPQTNITSCRLNAKP